MYKDTGPTDGQGSKAKRLLSAQPARRHRLQLPPPSQGSGIIVEDEQKDCKGQWCLDDSSEEMSSA